MRGASAPLLVLLASSLCCDGARLGTGARTTRDLPIPIHPAGQNQAALRPEGREKVLRQSVEGIAGDELPLEGVFFAVMSYPINVRGRNAIRATWMRDMVALGAHYKFFLGADDRVNQFVAWEDVDKARDDVVLLEGLRDSHFHLSFKTGATAQWIHEHVNASYIIKIDEDVLPVAQHLAQVVPGLPRARLYAGQLVSGESPPKNGKYMLPKEFREAVLDENGNYPDYVRGNLYILSADTVATLASQHDPRADPLTLLPFEDIHVAMVLRGKAEVAPTDLSWALPGSGDGGTQFLLSRRRYRDICAHDAVPSLCANYDFMAYHPVSPWLMLRASAAAAATEKDGQGKQLRNGVHNTACKYFDLDHSRFWRERNQTLEYYELKQWYEPERVVFGDAAGDSNRQQLKTAPPESSTAVFLVLADLGEVTRLNVRKWRAMAKRSEFAAKILYDVAAVDRDALRELAGNAVQLISMSMKEQAAIYPNASYMSFSGLYGAPAKPAEITWMASEGATKGRGAEAQGIEHAWFVESDVFFSGRYETLFRKYLREPADLVSPHFAANAPGYPDTFWHFWADCELASGSVHAHSLISLHRISRALARDVYAYLQSGRGGHHEYVVPQLCIMKPGCAIHQLNPHENTYYYRYRPAHNLEWVRENWVADRIYHPVKSQAQIDEQTPTVEQHKASAMRRAEQWQKRLAESECK